MATETFRASRLTKGNRLFPTLIQVTDTAVVRTKRSWFHRDEMSIHILRVASVHIETGILWSHILIESTGGGQPIASRGHRKADALRIKELIEQAQSRQLTAVGTGAPGLPREE
jgi:hypothetical protein